MVCIRAGYWPNHFSPAGDLAVQLPLAHQEHSAGMARPHFVHLWSSKHLCGVVPDMEAQQMGDAQPHSGVDGQRVCMRPYHQHDQDHGTAWTSQLDQVLLHLNLVFSAL